VLKPHQPKNTNRITGPIFAPGCVHILIGKRTDWPFASRRSSQITKETIRMMEVPRREGTKGVAHPFGVAVDSLAHLVSYIPRAKLRRTHTPSRRQALLDLWCSRVRPPNPSPCCIWKMYHHLVERTSRKCRGCIPDQLAARRLYAKRHLTDSGYHLRELLVKMRDKILSNSPRIMPMMNPMGCPAPRTANAVFFDFPGGKYEEMMLIPAGVFAATATQ
jgi:hypothetical protein